MLDESDSEEDKPKPKRDPLDIAQRLKLHEFLFNSDHALRNTVVAFSANPDVLLERVSIEIPSDMEEHASTILRDLATFVVKAELDEDYLATLRSLDGTSHKKVSTKECNAICDAMNETKRGAKSQFEFDIDESKKSTLSFNLTPKLARFLENFEQSIRDDIYKCATGFDLANEQQVERVVRDDLEYNLGRLFKGLESITDADKRWQIFRTNFQSIMCISLESSGALASHPLQQRILSDNCSISPNLSDFKLCECTTEDDVGKFVMSMRDQVKRPAVDEAAITQAALEFYDTAMQKRIGQNPGRGMGTV